ncbi:hypothetical protein F5B21DRAFT_497106 [Xylaria acuta]|nr:hypothetical protein F5B21DRAFT_497106 [Xylaria acuta]
MSYADEDPDIARKNLVKRRRSREGTMLKKAYELYVDHETEVYMVFHHHQEDRYRVFTTQPSDNFPPPFKKLKTMYPVPIVHTPETLGALLERKRRASRAGVANGDTDAELGILPRDNLDEQDEDVGRGSLGDGHRDIVQVLRPCSHLPLPLMLQDPFVLKPAPLPVSDTPVYRAERPEYEPIQELAWELGSLRAGSPPQLGSPRPAHERGGPFLSERQDPLPWIVSSMPGSGDTSSPASSSVPFVYDQRWLAPQTDALSSRGPAPPSPQETPAALRAHGGGVRKAGSRSGRGRGMRLRDRGRFMSRSVEDDEHGETALREDDDALYSHVDLCIGSPGAASSPFPF